MRTSEQPEPSGRHRSPAGGAGRRPDAPGAGRRAREGVLPLLGEIGVVGVLVAVLSVPVVTAVPALAAGACHLRRHRAGGEDATGRLLGDLRAALRELWWLGVAVPVVLVLAGYNVWLAWSGALPGPALVGAVSVGVACAAAVVALRTAGGWSPGSGGGATVGAAVRRAARDVLGSALLLGAVVVGVLLVQGLEALVLLVGGLLALAAVAVEDRWARRAARPLR